MLGGELGRLIDAAPCLGASAILSTTQSKTMAITISITEADFVLSVVFAVTIQLNIPQMQHPKGQSDLRATKTGVIVIDQHSVHIGSPKDISETTSETRCTSSSSTTAAKSAIF